MNNTFYVMKVKFMEYYSLAIFYCLNNQNEKKFPIIIQSSAIELWANFMLSKVTFVASCSLKRKGKQHMTGTECTMHPNSHFF